MKYVLVLWQKWKQLAHKIGIFQSKVILTVFYFLLTPFGIFFSLFKDNLKIKTPLKTSWINKEKQSENLSDLQQQY